MGTKTDTIEFQGQTYHKIAMGDIVEKGDRWISDTQNKPAKRVGLPAYSEHYYYRIPDPETREYVGKIYRRLEYDELVETGDLCFRHIGEPFKTGCKTGEGCKADVARIYWRECEFYLFESGERWTRLPAYAYVIPGDRTGIIKPGPHAPEGTRVRKSRHVWRRAKVLPEFENSPGYNLGQHKYTAGSNTHITAVLSFGTPDPYKYTDEDGRPWRRLELGEKMRHCDRLGDDKPKYNGVSAGSKVHGMRNVWRPAGPPVETIEHEGKKYRRMRDDELVKMGDLFDDDFSISPSNNFGGSFKAGDTRNGLKYYRPLNKQPTPKPPPPGFVDYLRTCCTIVDGYRCKDLVRWIESVQS